MDKRRRGWLWIVAVLVMVPVVYVASFGPACRMTQNNVVSTSNLATAYRPCIDVALRGPEWARRGLWRWAGVWGGETILAVLSVEETSSTHLSFPDPSESKEQIQAGEEIKTVQDALEPAAIERRRLIQDFSGSWSSAEGVYRTWVHLGLDPDGRFHFSAFGGVAIGNGWSVETQSDETHYMISIGEEEQLTVELINGGTEIVIASIREAKDVRLFRRSHWTGGFEGSVPAKKWTEWNDEPKYRLTEGNLRNGKKDGEWTAWRPNGAVEWRSHYVNGKLEGQHQTFFVSGSCAVSGQYSDGLKNGMWTEFDKEGNTIWKLEYRQDLPWNGTLIEWIVPGSKPYRSGGFRNGQRHGQWLTWDINGQRFDVDSATVKEHYNDGQLNSSQD